ncbi:MAG: hypothetical protein OSJ60_11765 [Lachnospiraceae bacterium]|nr:hypothetical protein [Lachnospiraceae bacterium]
METTLTKNRKKQLSQDLWIIFIVSFVVLAIFMFLNNKMKNFADDSSINIVFRVLVIGVGAQFGLAGLGITIVCILRKEKFQSFGLNTKNLLPALFLSLACCIPDFIYCVSSRNVHAWCPFWDVNTTPEVLKSGFPANVLGMLITAVCWGFFEGFNYVVIRDKLSELYPSRYKFLDWGALICAIMCILVHGAIGVTPDAVIEMVVTMFLIYGMLLVRKLTGNAWGCVLIFMVYWNAL